MDHYLNASDWYLPTTWDNGENHLEGIPESAACAADHQSHVSSESAFFKHASPRYAEQPSPNPSSPGHTLVLTCRSSLGVGGTFSDSQGPWNAQGQSPSCSSMMESHSPLANLNLTPHGLLTASQSRPRRKGTRPKVDERRYPVQRHHVPSQPIGVFKCEWKDCRYMGIFSRKGELQRHVITQHISPGAFECSEPGCRKTFNRLDNMKEHFQRVHLDVKEHSGDWD
ncbi:hypothetical protein BDW62DRAFT_192842 [Aspergillus aurantiobrunneus]